MSNDQQVINLHALEMAYIDGYHYPKEVTDYGSDDRCRNGLLRVVKLLKYQKSELLAPHLAKIKRLYDALKIAHEALIDVKGYGFKPKTYEIIKAALSETTPDNTQVKED